MKLAMGMYDAPQTQEQPIFYLNPILNNIAVFGSPMTGKTNFVKTYLVRLSEHAEIRNREDVYIIDFGGNIGEYKRLSVVCACFDNSNEENIKRVFKTLDRRLNENSKQLKSRNYYTVFKKNPADCPKHMTLIIENVNAFLADERYASYQERLLRLCRDGLSKGLTIMLTGNDLHGTTRLLSNFGQKIAFDMPQESYLEIFNMKVLKPLNLPGRGIINIDSSTYEYQCFLPFLKEEEVALDALIRKSTECENPNRMISFGDTLTLDNLSDYSVGDNEEKSEEAVVGLDYYDHEAVKVNYEESRAIAIYGKRHFGKTNLLQLLLKGMRSYKPDARVVYLDDGRKELEKLPDFGFETVSFSSVEAFRNYLVQAGYGGLERGRMAESSRPVPDRSRPGTPPGSLRKHQPEDTPYTVFVLQSKALYQNSTDANYLMKSQLPEMISNAEARGYVFIFSDVKNIANVEARVPFNNSISVAFLLDNIGEFITDKGNKSVFGEMDAKELKAEYAKCSIGDGYYYDVDADVLKKTRFVKVCE